MEAVATRMEAIASRLEAVERPQVSGFRMFEGGMDSRTSLNENDSKKRLKAKQLAWAQNPFQQDLFASIP